MTPTERLAGTLTRYGFTDRHEHPLENCADFRELVKRLEDAERELAGYRSLSPCCSNCGEVWYSPQYSEPRCTIPPPGSRCTREKGHEGPCAAWPVNGEPEEVS